jgi:NADPH:quinone reductase-like Zn-dependent oxidoreductase
MVHAASGGVGHLAVQIAKALGATVIGTGSPESHDWLRELGADEVIDYAAGPVSRQLEEHGGPVDAVLDLIGGAALEDAPAQVRDKQRIASVVDADTVRGLGGRYVFVRPERDDLAALARLVDHGKVRVTIVESFGLDDIAAAHRLSEAGHPRGKIVVRI